MISLKLKADQGYPSVLNTAIKQPTLSKKAPKGNTLTRGPEPGKEAIAKLDTALAQWKSSFDTLRSEILTFTNTKQKTFSQLDQQFKDYLKTSKPAIGQIERLQFHSIINPQIKEALRIESSYLFQVNNLINYYNHLTVQKNQKLQTLLLYLFILVLATLVLTFFIVLRPAAKNNNRMVEQLLEADKKAIENARVTDKLNQEKEQSLNQLKTLNAVMGQSLLFARIDPQGNIISAGSKFYRFFNYNSKSSDTQFSEIISNDKNDQEYFNNILHTHKHTGWQGEIKGSTPQGEQCWFEISINPYLSENNKDALLVVCFDITQRKNAQSQISQLTKEHFELEINRQKELSSKIIENQEKEQNRIAKDIHDGIGQMLTGLKFTIESIQASDVEKTSEKIEQLKTLTSEIIKGVRTATFNLSPPELTDYGIAASLSKLSQELSKFTGKEIVTINKTDFNLRLEPLMEINIYRIVQEAVNNAIKYAESSQIVISISHSEDMLSILIDDNGKGFDTKQVTQGENQGMGLTYMKERMAYIDGRLFITSNEKIGTRVTLNIPI